jgi:hypothetical protein
MRKLNSSMKNVSVLPWTDFFSVMLKRKPGIARVTVMPALGSMRKEGLKFEGSLGNVGETLSQKGGRDLAKMTLHHSS